MNAVVRRGAVLLTVILLILLYVIGTLSRYRTAPVNNTAACGVVIDAGHGGFDGGAVGIGGMLEKDVVLEVALLLEQELRDMGIPVVMTRNTDTGLEKNQNAKIRQRKREDMQERARIVRESAAAVFVSIHANKFEDSNQRGTQIFFPKNPAESEQLAKVMSDELKNQMPEAAVRAPLVAQPDLYLFKNLPMAASIVECGFITNHMDYAHLLDIEFKAKLAKTIAQGIRKYLEVDQ